MYIDVYMTLCKCVTCVACSHWRDIVSWWKLFRICCVKSGLCWCLANLYQVGNWSLSLFFCDFVLFMLLFWTFLPRVHLWLSILASSMGPFLLLCVCVCVCVCVDECVHVHAFVYLSYQLRLFNLFIDCWLYERVLMIVTWSEGECTMVITGQT